MIIRVKDNVRFRQKDGNYEDKVVDRCLIIGQKVKLEEKVAKTGNTFACLTLLEHNTYYHITVFDKEIIDVIRNDIKKDEMLIAVCDLQVVHNNFKNCEDEKYIMTAYMSNRKTILDNASSIPLKNTSTKQEEKELDFDDNDETFEFDDESLPF